VNERNERKQGGGTNKQNKRQRGGKKGGTRNKIPATGYGLERDLSEAKQQQDQSHINLKTNKPINQSIKQSKSQHNQRTRFKQKKRTFTMTLTQQQRQQRPNLNPFAELALDISAAINNHSPFPCRHYR